jgi:tRNA(Ile)-lysidine synthase
MITIKRVLDKSKHYYVAVSGGVDSVSAAYLLYKKGFNISIFHFNHNISLQNEFMENSVRRFADDLNIPAVFITRTGKLSNGSLEGACRDARFKAYSELDSDIIVNHHLDDCVESYVMNCFKGHPQYIPIPIHTVINDKVSIHRPFMLSSKQKFIDFASHSDLDKYIVEDQTNKDAEICRRNWVRNTILPEISKKVSLEKVVRKIMIKWYDNHISGNRLTAQC